MCGKTFCSKTANVRGVTDINNLRGAGMDDREIATFLREQGVGLLALARANDAYAVPISFGYIDGPRRIYFDLVRFGEDSLKVDYADRTETACFVTYEVESRFDWRSVIAQGPIETVPEADRDEMEATMEDNAWFPSLFPPDDPMTGVRRAVMELREVTGRKGEARQA